ncbi:peptide ABC transporter permease [Pseudomonas savastanoi pv. retacarpa]|uniref:Transporter, permease protein n=3 Tax=Pseudomonas savastanoi TaxID=29438 RepID=A0A3M5ULZ8_PSESS|nr:MULTISPECIES: ABC transporter permease [Pseudomonas]KPW72570.1 putative transporter, permease protein [Pseudomonas amygdali pv. ciccaronei]KPY48436.1 putative transporter, permease protein [Pseudomonas savastanoi pv. retacarpa]KPY70249.1 putative transporter, permease protein [Pseudomonas savastanoi pv. savastanoi]MBA4705113.1 ABC transporter permease [Pseudomonas savastanoi pv. savastanoi]MCQ3023261.1 ABC transporter permease [Pseudomonas savastanoi]
MRAGASRRVKVAASGLLSLSITLIGLLFFTFMLTTLSPVDPALRIAGDHASESSLAQVRTDLGLDQPWPARFGRYLNNLRQGDLGVSITSGQPVLEGLSRALPATLELATLAILLGSTLGLSLGLLAAWRPGGWVDGLVRLVSLIGYSVPIFWLGLLMLLLFYARLEWAGGPGRLDDSYLYALELSSGLMLWDTWRSGESGALANAFSHLVLPVLVLAFYSMAGICRMTRSALLGEMGKEYVVTALAKGAGRGRVLLRHVLPNVAGTLVVVVALSYASLLEGSILTETVFAWPGIGRYLTTALFAGDVPAILGSTLVIGLCFVVVNGIADVLAGMIDPRTRGVS